MGAEIFHKFSIENLEQKNFLCYPVLRRTATAGVEGLQVFNFIKKRLQHRCFLAKFASFLKHPI